MLVNITPAELQEQLLRQQQQQARDRANAARAAAARAEWSARVANGGSSVAANSNTMNALANIDWALAGRIIREQAQQAQVAQYVPQQMSNTADLSRLDAKLDNIANGIRSQSAELADHRKALEYLLGRDAREKPLGSGGAMGFYDRDSGLGSGGRVNGSTFKGGVCLSSTVLIPNNAQAGDTFVGTWTGDELARLLGTVACSIQFYTSADNANGGVLVANPERVRLELLVNGAQTLFRSVPLSKVINNADGSEKQAVLNLGMPEFASITYRATVIQNLNGDPLGIDTLYATIDAGDSCLASPLQPIPPNTNIQGYPTVQGSSSGTDVYNKVTGRGSCPHS